MAESSTNGATETVLLTRESASVVVEGMMYFFDLTLPGLMSGSAKKVCVDEVC